MLELDADARLAQQKTLTEKRCKKKKLTRNSCVLVLVSVMPYVASQRKLKPLLEASLPT